MAPFSFRHLSLGGGLFLAALALGSCWSPAQARPSDPVVDPRPDPDPAPTPEQIDLGPGVKIFSPSTPNLQAQVDALYEAQKANEFGSQRYALLFLPGTYHELHLKVGFYTQVLGLGANPDDVVFDAASSIQVWGAWDHNNSTRNFWRAAENFRFQNAAPFTLLWAVSQAAPLRRIHADHDLHLFEVGPNNAGMYASGGFLADSRIEGTVFSGSQQQWFTRNTQLGAWPDGVWNMVFAGTNTPTESNWTEESAYDHPKTVVPRTPAVREKPFLHLDAQGKYRVFVPGLRTDSQGPSWTSRTATSDGQGAGVDLSLGAFYVGRAETDTSATLNAALAAGKHLLLTPGVYDLDSPLEVTWADTVVLGLGLATLRPTQGQEALVVGDVKGVRIAGLLFDAGPLPSPALMRVGTPGTSLDQGSNPTTLSDLFFRVGGAAPAQAEAGLVVHANDVILDHTWIWRADHGPDGQPATTWGWTVNPAPRGLEVTGDRVTALGLAVEHFQEYQTLWSGEGGTTIFYQSELPYDIPTQADWTSTWKGSSSPGWASYKVADGVTTHHAWGLGVYGVYLHTGEFIHLAHAYEVPEAAGVRLTNAMDLTIVGEGTIDHLVNGFGGEAAAANFTAYPYVVEWPVAVPSGPPTLVLDAFTSSERWNTTKVNSLGKPITVLGGNFNLEGTTDLYFNFWDDPGLGFTETIGQSLEGYATVNLGILGADGGEQNYLTLVLNDGTDHRLSLAAYGPVTKAYTTLAVPLAAFGADLAQAQTLTLEGRGNNKTVKLTKITFKP